MQTLRVSLIALIVTNVMWSSLALAGTLAVEGLRCQLLEDPMAIDSARPRFCWFVTGGRRGEAQTAYRILVASSAELLAADRGDLWDSGKVASDVSIQIPYGGCPLKSGAACFWKVRAWGCDGEPSAWSAAARWSMGLMDAADWHGRWIVAPQACDAATAGKSVPLPLLRKSFSLAKPVRRAMVYVCGLGQCELSLNGKRVGKDVLDPLWSNYRKSVFYSAFDITDMLLQGSNALGAMLGNGMYNVPGGRYAKFSGSFGPPKLILELRIEYADGATATVTSDDTWKTAPGPITFSCIYGGEDYDARREVVAWNEPGFDDGAWQNAVTAEGPGGRLVARSMPPIRVMQRYPAIALTEPKPGVFVYDLGQNFSGWPRLTVEGPAGTVVKLIPGELLDHDGLVTQASSGGPVWFAYTLRGSGREVWNPRFSYTGFRYVQIECARPADRAGGQDLPKVIGIEGEFLHNASRVCGEFACSNENINRIHRLILAAIRSNFQSVLTDCPHREKLGWLEVSHLLAGGIMFNYDAEAFYAKICDDMRQSQLDNGMVPDIAPEYTVFGGGFRDSPEWGSAYVINPWHVYQMYGNCELLRKHYEDMKRYAAYLDGTSKNGIVSHGLGDWCDVGPGAPGESKLTSRGLTSTAVQYRNLCILRDTAKLLDRREDAAHYARCAEEMRGEFNREFFHAETNDYDRRSQTSAAMPLVLGLVDGDRRGAVLENLVKTVRGNGNRVTAGDVGYVFLVRALSDANRGDVLYDMVCEPEGPGYIYQLKQGATSLAETWDANRSCSWNHCMLGHVDEWFYRGLGGICPDASEPGFHKFVICPQVVGDVTWVNASYQSVRGPIHVAWKIDDGQFRMQIAVPLGATAVVHVPTHDAQAVAESGKPAADAPNVRFLRQASSAAVYEVPSGTYSFAAPW